MKSELPSALTLFGGFSPLHTPERSITKYVCLASDIEVRSPRARIWIRAKIAALAVLVLLAASQELLAQPHSLKWYAIGGGGGSSTGSVYAVRGTMGQHDAGQLRGGFYSMTGGFWSVAAIVSADDAPTLRIFRSDPNVVLAWPDPATGFQLQQSTGLTPPVWTDLQTAPTVVGMEKQITLPLRPGSQFFRLRKEQAK